MRRAAMMTASRRMMNEKLFKTVAMSLKNSDIDMVYETQTTTFNADGNRMTVTFCTLADCRPDMLPFTNFDRTAQIRDEHFDVFLCI